MDGLSPLIFVGPFVAAVGVVSVFFVMRHKAVQTKSMYSSRRAAIERKVKAARQRTLGPTKKEEVAAPAPPLPSSPAVPTFQPSAFEGPPVAPPAYNPASAVAPPPVTEAPPETSGSQPWEVGPTAPPPAPLPEILVVPPPPLQPEQVWSPNQQPAAPERPMVETPAGAGASWSIVGEAKEEAEVGSGKKKKKRKEGPRTSGWQLASGAEPGTFYEDEEVKGPSTAMAIAQYAVLVVGLIMVLIGVMVMLANMHVT